MSEDPQTWRLAEAAALVDAMRTGQDPEAQLERLDRIAAECAEPTFDAVHRLLFSDLGFDGQLAHYHHEHNSLLSHALDSRHGLPILLSIVTIDVAASNGVELMPVGMPGHFLLRHDGASHTVYLDAFGGGTLLDAAGCEVLFRRSNGPSAPFGHSQLDPIGPQEVVARLLANLRGTYAASGDLSHLRWILELRSDLPGIPAVEAFERAAVLDELGRHDEAAEVLDGLVDHVDTRVATAASHRARALRARNN